MPKLRTQQEALLLLKDGLLHAAKNPNIYSYVPHAKQVQFHRSNRKGKLYIGGNRSGKTTGGVCEDIMRATCRHPYRPELNAIGANRGRVVAVDFINGVEKIIFPQFQQWLYPSAMRGGAWETAYDKSLRTLNFSNGSFIEFMSYDQDLDKFSGTSRHWIHFDEECPRHIWQECKARLIDTSGDWYITMTPVEGMTWIYDDLYEPNIESEDPEIEIIEVEMYENPHLNLEAIQDYVRGLDNDELAKRVRGHFVQQGGRIYPNFNPSPGDGHVWKEDVPSFELADYFKDHLIIQSLDHGLNNPTSVHWHAVDANGFVVTFWEHYQAGWTIPQHAAAIKEAEATFRLKPSLRIIDPSTKNREATSGSSIQLEYQKLGLSFTFGNNDVRAGLAKVKRYMRNAPDIKGNLKPRWTCMPRNEKLRWELKKYRWKTYRQKSLNYENNNYEEPHKKDDHACDDLRYALMSRPDLVAASPADKANDILNKWGFIETSTASSPSDITRSDPNDRLVRWTEENTMPNDVGGDWSIDEHLGGVW
jgi:phage terminase large subunit-like protein